MTLGFGSIGVDSMDHGHDAAATRTNVHSGSRARGLELRFEAGEWEDVGGLVWLEDFPERACDEG